MKPKLSWTKRTPNFGKTEIGNPNTARLILYKEVKNKLKMEKYLELDFKDHKIITKSRCSDHCLEIEKGKHRNLPRNERVYESMR